jgi:hypothetical protein
VFCFNGCFRHGHHCLNNGDVPIAGTSFETLQDTYNRTMVRLDKILSAGYVCHVVWEREFDKILKENPALETCDKEEPLIIRHSLYGGRTEATKLYYKTDDHTRVKYNEIMSLYPYICKYFKFPIGHPTLYVGSECANTTNRLQKEGVISCRILAKNTSLYQRTLPYTCRNNLIFAFCRTCAHGEIERECAGTWVIDEVRKAVEMG